MKELVLENVELRSGIFYDVYLVSEQGLPFLILEETKNKKVNIKYNLTKRFTDILLDFDTQILQDCGKKTIKDITVADIVMFMLWYDIGINLQPVQLTIKEETFLDWYFELYTEEGNKIREDLSNLIIEDLRKKGKAEVTTDYFFEKCNTDAIRLYHTEEYRGMTDEADVELGEAFCYELKLIK